MKIWCRALLLAVFVSAAVNVGAQSLYGTLVGNVTDETGAALPGASVTVTQTETNLSRDVMTNESGGYTVPNLLPGTYQVAVTLQGFKSYTARDIAVRPDLVLRVDARLGLGTLEESIVVSGTSVVLQTESAAVQSLTTADQLVTIPTSGRAWQTTIALMPGVAQPDYSQSGGSNNPTRAMAISINGQPANNTVVRLDGVTQINQFFQQIQAYSPSLESIETVSVVTNSFDADQGMAGGASVNVQVKSGTNQLRGSLFEFAQDYKMKATNYFLPPGDPKGSGSVHVFGGTAGGPIVRNKLFYFGSVESTRQRTTAGTALSNSGANGLRNLPTMDMRTGNFAGTNTVIYDPRTGSAANGSGRVPFAFANCGINSTTDPRFDSCNYIPANRISPIATDVLSKLVAPTLPGFQSNYYATNKYDTDYRKYDGKITWVPNNRVTVNGRLGYATSYEDSAPALPYVENGVVTNGPNNPIWQGRIWDSTVHSHSLAITNIVSSNLVVDGVFGFTRTDMLARPHTDDCWGDMFDIPNTCQPPYGRSTAFPAMNASSWSISGGGEPRAYRDPQWGGNVNAGWTKGGHNVKFGGELKRLHQNHYETQSPQFTFTGGRTALGPSGSPNNFNAFADFLLGEANSRRSEIMTPMIGIEQTGEDFRPGTLRTWQFGTFIRDQFELTPKMTVSVGVRWEYYPLSQRRDRGLEVFDFDARQLLICGQAGIPQTCGVTVEKNLLTPRLGWAYRPTDSLVVRVGYSRNPQNDTSGREQMPPFNAYPATIIYTETAANTYNAIGTLAQGFPMVPVLDLTVGYLNPVNAGLTTYPLNGEFERGKISSWNVSMQQLLPYGHSLTLGYVANRQNGLTRSVNQNYGQLGGGTASQPYASITTNSINIQAPESKVKYDSAQASVNKRMSNGLQYSFAYTYAKTIDWWASTIPQPEYWYLNKGETGLPHTLNISVVYELPFGSGRKFLADGALGKVVGGWQVNSFITSRSGQGLGVSSSATPLNAGNGTPQRADQVKDEVEIFGAGTPGPQTAYFDVLAFKPVTDIRFGDSPLLAFRGPSYTNLDMSLFRTFALKRNMSLQLRIEALNVTNTPHFSNPGTNVSNLQLNPDGTVRNLNGFGVITSTTRTGRQYDEREWRLGLRLGF
jgi:hypothetical protein